MDVFFWAIAPRVVFWTRFEANFRLGGNRRPLFLNGLTSPRVPGQLHFFNLAAWSGPATLGVIRPANGNHGRMLPVGFRPFASEVRFCKAAGRRVFTVQETLMSIETLIALFKDTG